MTPEEKLADLRFRKAQASIADVQNRLNAPHPGRDGLTVAQRYDQETIAHVEARFPALCGVDTADPLNDQLDAAFDAAHRIVDGWLAALTLTYPVLGAMVGAVLASQDYYVGASIGRRVSY
ncbi:hypothetical protein [Mycolicibacterium grossiae]|uniref:Uncharacterized protein n=1 Tax=Mycolicibacterium grossiae TaxID=1552759 RepID=A0A1E8PVZ8_9MYCO|nr:hypothetical protein [Mycolicibacterium grossiae]OFJ50492.1 hypothetical protein BEL07_27935 [Mycolicibacterium grossiae]QEM46606.1 hypothetical protein FZ046_19150 [Mycolicibacterium grossiae]